MPLAPGSASQLFLPGTSAGKCTRPWQTAVGVAAVSFVMVASIAGMNNILARILGTTTDAVNPFLQAALLLWPPAAGVITYLVLQAEDTGDPGRTATATDGGTGGSADGDATDGSDVTVDGDGTGGSGATSHADGEAGRS